MDVKETKIMKKIRYTLLCLPLAAIMLVAAGCGDDRKETTASFPQESTAPESVGMTETNAPDGAGSMPSEEGTVSDGTMSDGTMPDGTAADGTTGDLSDGLDEMGDDISRAADDLMDGLTDGTKGTDNR